MIDTSRPTVEALIADAGILADPKDRSSRAEMQSMIRRSAEVLGALLTERDVLIEAALDHRATASRALQRDHDSRAQIAEARERLGGYILQESQDGGAPDPDVVAADDALSRGVQEATEPGYRFRFPSAGSFMRVCPTCGNKRCPHVDPRFRCTGSNEPGQVGVLEATEPSELWTDPEPYLNPENGDRYNYRDAWPSMVNLDHRPRTRAVYDAETKGKKP